ncbi:hypothetical protein Tco_0705179 [Tanacetum coccineum]|uniref:Uncharacterized protein n=1 Tax=Tanacetum coccineum TaxID=301880 RepID=A0ABQ4Y5E3_9ASTR
MSRGEELALRVDDDSHYGLKVGAHFGILPMSQHWQFPLPSNPIIASSFPRFTRLLEEREISFEEEIKTLFYVPREELSLLDMINYDTEGDILYLEKF